MKIIILCLLSFPMFVVAQQKIDSIQTDVGKMALNHSFILEIQEQPDGLDSHTLTQIINDSVKIVYNVSAYCPGYGKIILDIIDERDNEFLYIQDSEKAEIYFNSEHKLGKLIYSIKN